MNVVTDQKFLLRVSRETKLFQEQKKEDVVKSGILKLKFIF